MSNNLIYQDKRIFKCPECLEMFKSQKDLLTHQEKMEHYPKKVFICPICPEMFKSQKDLQTHQEKMEHFPKEDFICPKCNQIFKTISDKNFHLSIRHLDSFPCRFCLKKFETKEELIKHIEICPKNTSPKNKSLNSNDSEQHYCFPTGYDKSTDMYRSPSSIPGITGMLPGRRH